MGPISRAAFLITATFLTGLGLRAQQHNIDPKNSTITIHVGKTGMFSGLGHEHEITAPIRSGTAEEGSRPSVEVRVNARELRVTGKDEPENDRPDVQKTMLGPEVLDSEHYQEILFKSSATEAAGPGRWTVRGNLTLHGQTHPVTLDVTLKEGHYIGSAVMKLTDFGIKPPGKPGIRVKDEVKVDFDVRLAS